ncbi:MAG TPA: CPBP family intramembrane glutamic endopeptidase [Phycisphaerae bacterium]
MHRKRQVAAIALTAMYVSAIFVWPPRSWSPWVGTAFSRPKDWLFELIHRCFSLFGQSDASSFRRYAAYFLLVQLVIPWSVMLLIRRGRPRDLGLRRPNRLALRIALPAYLISVPFLIWMVRSPGFVRYYRPALEESMSGFLLMYLAAIVGEHFLFHGVMLAAFHPSSRWPSAEPPLAVRTSGVRGVLQWLGIAHPVDGATGWNRAGRWLGLRDGCLVAILASAALFALVHLGKDSREMLLSIPGGLAEAYLAYRTNSLLTPMVLHLATAGTACAAMVLLA